MRLGPSLTISEDIFMNLRVVVGNITVFGICVFLSLDLFLRLFSSFPLALE